MEGGDRGSSNSPPPFLTKTYDMVDDPSTDSIVSWSASSASFVVWNQLEFARDLLPKYFKHNNFSSFVRQLNTYGFRKVDPDQWEFANEEFIRGQRQLLKNIQRRKSVHSHSLHSTLGPLSEEEKQELEDEIERLKQEKAALINELQNHTQLRHGMEDQMQSLEERLLILEKRQRGLMDLLKRVVQEPQFLSDLVQQSDLQRKKRRLPKIVFLNEDAMEEDDQIVAFQPMSREKPDMFSMQALDMEPFKKMESSLNSLENLIRGVSQASGDDMLYYNIEPCLQSDAILTETHASTVENDANLHVLLAALRPHSPGSEHNNSSPDIVECTSHVNLLVTPATENETDLRSKVAVIDVNLEPAATEVDSSRDQTAETTSSTVPTGVNDVFWEQFLTEIPGSSNTQEVESKRRDPDDKQSERKMQEQESTWWNRKCVNHLAAKMGI